MKFQYKTLLISALCFLLVVFIFIQYNPSDQYIATVVFQTEQGNVSIQCRIANDDQSRSRGLLDVTHLEQSQGMLFLYDSMQSRIFTMKHMKIPLDIIFVDTNKTVIHIVEADIDDEHIESNGPAQYVIEINRGLTEKNHIRVGTIIEITYQNN